MGVLTLLAGAVLAVVPVHASTTLAPLPTPTTTLEATPFFRHYNIDQGLPSSFVYTVAQDRHGAIWVGTISGLTRFNGTHFKVYRHISGDASSIASNDVSCLLVDGKGQLWAGGGGNGVNLYEPATDSFRHFKHDPNRPDSLASSDVMALANGLHGTLWVGTYANGLDHMTSPGHFQHLTHDPHDPHSLVSNTIWSLFSRGKSRLWIGTNKGMDILEPDGNLRHVHFQGLKSAPLIWGIDGDAHQVRADTSKGLFVVGDNGVAKRIPLDTHKTPTVLSSVRDKQGDMWLGTSSGLFLIHGNQTSYFPARPLVPGGQPGKLIYKVMLDHEGGLWLATRNDGLAYLRPDWRHFSHHSHLPGVTDSLAQSHVMAITPDGHGNLWIGDGNDSLDKLNPATGTVTHFKDKLGSTHRRILSMARAGAQGLWLGYGRSLSLFMHGHLQTVIKPLSQGTGFLRMVSDAAGNLYASALNKGVYRVDRQTLKAQPLTLAFNNANGRHTSALLLHDGHLWRASNAGIAWLPSNSRRLVPVTGIAKGAAAAMAIHGSNLWLVRPKGLEHYRLHDHKATLLHRTGAAEGWPGITTYSMMVDSHGRVWLFAAAGLWRFDPQTRHFKHFGKNDGLPSPVFTTRQLAHIGPDTVFAGTMNGVVGFHPSTIVNRSRKPQLNISSIVLRRGGKDVTLPPSTHQIHLRWNDRDLRITAHALSYIAPKRNHYRFMLTGLDNDWVDTGTRGTRELAGLPAGHYVLKVEAAGASGVWAKLATPLSIDVDAPPWLRPWAWAIYVLVVLTIAWLIFLGWRRRVEQRHRVQMAEQKRQMAEQASAAKTRFLANLGHEIRTPMTGVLGMTELLLEGAREPGQRSYIQAIRHSGELLLKLVNDALDLARIETGRFELEPTDFDPRLVLADVRQLLQGQAVAKGLTLVADVDAAVPAGLHGDRLRVQQIMLNLTGNAIKFTRNGGVTLHAAWSDAELVLQVRDTGPGISAPDRERLFQRFEQAASPERSSGSGLGLAICRELASLMGGHITLDSEPGKGSHFSVFLPLPVVTKTMDTPTPAAPRTSVSRHILLVEDDATVARVIVGLLEHRGHTVTHAMDGLDALGALEQGHVELVLMDLDLPGMSGYQLTDTIRQRDDARHIPIAAITARSGGDEEQHALAAGMDAFARKPITGDQLAALVERLCPEG